MADTCTIVRAGESRESIDGVSRATGISSLTAGSHGLCVQISTLPGGATGKAHMHEHHESAIYVLEGGVSLWFGDELQERIDARVGDFVYIPANMPHLPRNLSDDPVVVLVARTDPNEDESLTVLPHLDGLPHITQAS